MHNALNERNQTFYIAASYYLWNTVGYREHIEEKLHCHIGKYLIKNLPQDRWTAVRPVIQWPSERDLYIAKEQSETKTIEPVMLYVRVRFEFMNIPQSPTH